MELKWMKRGENTLALTGTLKGVHRTLGWVLPRLGNYYKVEIAGYISLSQMPCEDQHYVTLRDAMRATKATVTVLLIGRGYGT